MEKEQDISQLLHSWGYEQTVIDKFKDEGIEYCHLNVLTEYSIEKLFPKIGERTSFMQKIQTLQNQEPPAKKRRKSHDSDITTTSSSSSSNILTLEEILNGTEGKMILSYYKTEKKLSDYYRQMLADEVVKQELRHDIQKSFANIVIEYWSDLIVNYFREESYETAMLIVLFVLFRHRICENYYSLSQVKNSEFWIKIEVWAGCSKGRNRDSSAGRGILLNRYYNMRRKLLKAGAISKSKKKLSILSEGVEKITDDETDKEHDELITWLQNTRGVNLALETGNWERTTSKRLSMLKGSMEIHEYMDNFPALKCSDGYRLLEMDFGHLYPDAALQLYSEWPTLSAFIINKIPVKEQNAINDCCTSDGKKVKTLRALSLLLPIKNIVMKKKVQWRPSRLETKDGFIQYVKSAAEVLPTNLHNKENCFQRGLTLGPQLFAVSPDEDNITECFLMINDTMYNVDSSLKAFDIFFKVFHALHCCYPKQTEREMYFLQRAVYNIQCDSDKQIRDSKTEGLIYEYNKYKTV